MITETYIAIQKPDEEVVIFKIDKVAIHPRTAYGQSGKTTEITLADNKTWWNPQADTFDVIRGTMVYAQSEQLELADDVNEKEVKKDTITLDECYLYLKTGQIIILSGERKDLKGVIASEVMKISEVKIEGGFTTLKFEKSLAYAYVRNTVAINANVALATHGETVHEALGSGDASKAFQSFTLRQTPLTYMSAAMPNGVQSTLEIRVNDLLWKEVQTLYGHGPDGHIILSG